ncbi:hypothetical protein [Croceicoccus gelatinilyticus]|uniref:hypothetical protein n=1 Tax=Croceicoccus gelatinilyticus TaxID=2835536 RepID=UPI001BCFDA65|nr:hypothetical protein [Croceicoccus gelatinilyticus]MBS7671419.1 hypothetical protein [Croceicoccus gelatinilyticus]
MENLDTRPMREFIASALTLAVREGQDPNERFTDMKEYLGMEYISKSEAADEDKAFKRLLNENAIVRLDDGEPAIIEGNKDPTRRERIGPKSLAVYFERGDAHVEAILTGKAAPADDIPEFPAHIGTILEAKGFDLSNLQTILHSTGFVAFELDGCKYEIVGGPDGWKRINCEVSQDPVVRVNLKTVTVTDSAIPDTIRNAAKGQPLGQIIGIEHMKDIPIKSVRTAQGMTIFTLDLPAASA